MRQPTRVTNDRRGTRGGARQQTSTSYSNLEVPYYLAILGGEINSETVYGAVDVKIPAGTQHGYEITFKGKGVPKIGSDAVGDHIFIIKIIIPKKVSSKEKKLLKEVQDQSRDKGKGFFS